MWEKIKDRTKWLLLPCIILLTIYAPLELTRIIVINCFIRRLYVDIVPMWEFIAELILLWGFYIGAMVIVCWLIKKLRMKGK